MGTRAVLEKVYGQVICLKEFLAGTVKDLDSSRLVRSGDTPAYVALVDDSCVAFRDYVLLEPKFAPSSSRSSMRDAIDRAHLKLLKDRDKANIFCYGYALSRTGKVENRFVNTLVTALENPEWNTLLARVGLDAMANLLAETSLFVTLPNDCLCQVTGPPMSFLRQTCRIFPFNAPTKRKPTCTPEDEPPVKRRRVRYRLQLNIESLLKSPADVPLVRFRIFHSKPACLVHSGIVAIGLAPNHVLNRLQASFQKPAAVSPESYIKPNARKQAADVRHLSKHVFPRQYGLASAFLHSKTNYKEAKIIDYTNRDLEITKMGPCKTPKQIKPVLILLDQLLWKHGKCGYKPLRDKTAPSKITPQAAVDSSIILDLVSERSSLDLQSQAFLGDVTTSTIGATCTQHMRPIRGSQAAKPRFTEFTCSYAEVCRFVVEVTGAVIPKKFWGGDKNYRIIMAHVKALVAGSRHETMSVHHILQGFSVSECEWVCFQPANNGRVSADESLRRRELVEDFLYWYFDSFVLSLLKTSFYVTESTAFRNRMLYFRHDDWKTLCAPLLERMTAQTFEVLSKEEADVTLRQHMLGYSFIRLKPKETGLRPIVNLRRRRDDKKSINEILQTAFRILTYEKERQANLTGVAINGHDEQYAQLKEYQKRLPRSPSGNLPKLYFVKLDVAACFDTIPQDELISILQNIVRQDRYAVQSWVQFGQHGRRSASTVIQDDEPHSFLDLAKDLASTLRSTVFIDKVKCTTEARDKVDRLLAEHIKGNIIGKKYHKQVVGIPQGSILSSLLCSFFYGDLERNFDRFTKDPASLMMRLVDDYLFVTTSLSKAHDFLQTMSDGHPKYGCFISKDKTLTNFDHGDQIMNVLAVTETVFPWCGLKIHMTDLSVTTDYSRYQHEIQDALTVTKGRKEGKVFFTKMLRQAVAKSHPIFCDTDFNPERVVYTNVYQNFVLSAMKMHRYLRIWKPDMARSRCLVLGTIRKSVDHAYSSIRFKSESRLAKANHAKANVHKGAFHWLGLHAHHAVLRMRSKGYLSVLKSLKAEMSLPKHSRSRRRFRALVKAAWLDLAHISF